MPPPGIKGVYEHQLTGEPAGENEAKLWAVIAQLSVIAGYLISGGILLGWLGPLIVFLIYKDRNRFVRFQAAEALNGALTVLIFTAVLFIVLGIFGIVTLGFGLALFGLIWVPAIIHGVFTIIAAIQVFRGKWWNYPVNLRMFR